MTTKRRSAARAAKGYLREFCVALLESAVVLIAMAALYIAAYLAFYQRWPRWK